MKKSKRIIVGIVLATGLLASCVGLLAYDEVVPVLGPILPRPGGVPRLASATYDFKEGYAWNWHRTLEHGCAKWNATGTYASVTLVHDGKGCDGAGPTLDYDSFAEQIVFDTGRGDWSGGGPCPFSIHASQIASFLELAREARAAAQTEAEEAVLLQVEQRLVKADGDELTTDHLGGCNDLRITDYSGPSKRHVDVWN